MQTVTRRQFILAAAVGAAAVTLHSGGIRRALAAERIRIGEQDALLVIDAQNCFAPGGSLPVARGDEVVPVINGLAGHFSCVVLTQDWHPAGHVSFASAHSKQPFSTIDMPYGTQVMWPDHCVQGTPDASLLSNLDVTKASMILRKGFSPKVDGYSAFFDNDHRTSTGLDGYLRARGMKRVFMAGLATDFCVMWSALDARKLGFQVVVIEDACRGIDLQGSLQAAWNSMLNAGVVRAQSGDLIVA